MGLKKKLHAFDEVKSASLSRPPIPVDNSSDLSFHPRIFLLSLFRYSASAGMPQLVHVELASNMTNGKSCSHQGAYSVDSKFFPVHKTPRELVEHIVLLSRLGQNKNKQVTRV